jgi:DNA-binding MarR family transcriptional regulator
MMWLTKLRLIMDKIHNKDVVSQLKELGFTAHEAAVYLACLRLEESSTGSIIKESKLHSEQVYRVLRKLLNEGYVSETEKNNISYFSAIDPSVLVNRTRTKLAMAESLLPYLSSLKGNKRQIVQVWEGEEAVKKQLEDVLNNTLNEGEECLILGGVGEIFTESFKKYLPMFAPLFKKKNIKERTISFKGYDYPSDIPAPFGGEVSTKTLDRPPTTPISTIIYGNKYALDVIDPDNIVIITIENEKVANSLRQTFEALWK